MPFYHCQGNVPAKRHVQARNEDGSLVQEEVFGSRGFDGRYSILYHVFPPTQVLAYEVLSDLSAPEEIRADLKHRHLELGKAKPSGDPASGRKVVLSNNDVQIGFCAATEEMNYLFCNANCDELVFVQKGSGSLRTQFGELIFKQGDYVVIPKGTICQWKCLPEETFFLVIETPGNIELPRRFFNEYGQLLEHSPFYTRDIKGPKPVAPIKEKGNFEVRIKTRSHLMSYRLGHHPFDVIGWDGYLYPYIFNILDFEPVTGRIHMPPPVHQTFAGPNFVVCSFVPRLVDYHPNAVPAPYNHSNLQSDEVLFYVNGNFMSRKGIQESSLTFHPAGIPHGPQPDAIEQSLGMTNTNETAVMIDTFQPLNPTNCAFELEDNSYALSWSALGSGSKV